MKETTRLFLYYGLLTSVMSSFGVFGKYVVFDHYYNMMESGKIAVSYVMANYNYVMNVTAIMVFVYSILVAGAGFFVEKLLSKWLFELD